jgi:hypothetical protein
MPVYRASLIFPADGTLPRDNVSIHPHYGGSDPQAVANILKTNLDNWAGTAGKPYTIKIYDAEKAPPSFPLATVTNPGTPPSTSAPREVSLCLSYYSTWNRPRYRGRLYLPAHWTASSPGVRPSDASMAQALTFATDVLKKNLPAATNWVVWSRMDRKPYGVTDVWVDDEWDTVRSRGLRGTKRSTVKV